MSYFLSVVLILFLWARYIEPKLLSTTYIFPLFSIGKKMKLVQLSDLHAYQGCAKDFFAKIRKKIETINPDLIVITGDFLCWGKTDHIEPFKAFLKELKAPLGIYVVLGNHDYDPSLSINAQGEYDVEADESKRIPLLKILKRFFSSTPLNKQSTPLARKTEPSKELLKMLKESNITLLDNRTVQIDNSFNLTGVGEYMGGHADLEKAFQGFDPNLKGILLAHNPDVFVHVLDKPCDLILSGHTHGGQLNLPYLWRKFTLIEHPEYKQGLFSNNSKQLYVSRGLGSAVPVRLNAFPEIVCVEWDP